MLMIRSINQSIERAEWQETDHSNARPVVIYQDDLNGKSHTCIYLREAANSSTGAPQSAMDGSMAMLLWLELQLSPHRYQSS